MTRLPNRHESVMDADMLALWHEAGPLLEGIVLYGGTALALYLGHRTSFDFDFLDLRERVSLDFVAREMAPFNNGALSGGEGMVDVTHRGANRMVRITVMEAERGFAPVPVHAPVPAANGVAVADLRDVVAGKLRALASRGLTRDYEDIGHCWRLAPDAVLAAAEILDAERDDLHRIARVLGSPDDEVARKCGADVLAWASDSAVGIIDAARQPPGPGE